MPSIENLKSPETIITAKALGEEIIKLRAGIENVTQDPLDINKDGDAEKFADIMKLGFEKNMQRFLEPTALNSGNTLIKNPDVCKGLGYAAVHGAPEYALGALESVISDPSASFEGDPALVQESVSELLSTMIRDQESLDLVLNTIKSLKERGADIYYYENVLRSAIEFSPLDKTFNEVYSIIGNTDVFKQEGFEEEDREKKWVSFTRKTCKLGGVEQVKEYLDVYFKPEDMAVFGDYTSHSVFREYLFDTMAPSEVKSYLDRNIGELTADPVGGRNEDLSNGQQLEAALAWFTTIQWLVVSNPAEYQDKFNDSIEKLVTLFKSNKSVFEKALSSLEIDEQSDKMLISILLYNRQHYTEMGKMYPENRDALLNTFEVAFSASEEDLIANFKYLPKSSEKVVTPESVESSYLSIDKLDQQFLPALANITNEEVSTQFKEEFDKLVENLEIEDIYFLRKFIERYGLMSDEVVSLLTSPDHTQKLEIYKTGSKLEIFVGGKAHGIIKRTQRTECNNVWENASKLSPYTDDPEKRPIAVEPIFKRSNFSNLSPEGKDAVYTRFCGLTIPRLRGVLNEIDSDGDWVLGERIDELDNILEHEKQRIRRTLLEAGIDHGHAHPENFTVEFIRKSYVKGKNLNNNELVFEKDNVTFDPRNWIKNPGEWEVVVRIIDFDRAKRLESEST